MIINLSVHKNTLNKRKRRACYEALVSSVKTIPKDYDGWALISFQNTDKGGTKVITYYNCVNPIDTARLADLAKAELIAKYGDQNG